MRIATFVHRGAEQVGVVEGDAVRPLPAGTSVTALLVASVEERAALEARAAAAVPLADVVLRPALHPPAIRDFVTFEQHIEGMVQGDAPGSPVPPAWYTAPAFYFTNPNAVLATGDDVEVPPGCERLDYELEVAAIIGRPGRDLTLDNAREHIAGYTIFNDWSARDLQVIDRSLGMGWAKGKDFGSTLGPWIVTADELEPYRDAGGSLALAMTVERNGAVMGTDNLASAAWSFEQMLVYASRGAALVTGDVIGSGTCGSGCLAEGWGRRGVLDPPPLQPDDVITMSVQGLGSITNRVVAGAARRDVGPPRRRTTVRD